MLTKEQKKEIIKNEAENLKNSRSIIFIDFTGVKTGDLNSFRKAIREVGGELKVIKKKLLRIAFDNAGIDFDPETFESQVGTILSEDEIFTIAGPTYKFESATILGGYNLEEKRFVPAEEVIALGKLPSKEVLLGQLVGMVSAPIRSFMFVLKERASKIA
ncbi:MAG: 50S ribosomal protein L10 [Candidatus Colwellbacteria bacterium]|nr:50S ribosomal protein L10 [Candidatus Colwellbacteria bacterium]